MPCLELDSIGEIAVPFRMVSGIGVVRVRVFVELRTLTGEWITDTRKGLPILDWIGEPGYDSKVTGEQVAAIVRARLQTLTGVVSVDVTATRSGTTIATVVKVSAEEEGETGVFEVAGVFDPYNTTPAPAWYLVDPATGLA